MMPRAPSSPLFPYTTLFRSDWKASLIGDLVHRCRLVMAGEPLPQPDPIDPRYLSLAAEVGIHVEITPADSPRSEEHSSELQSQFHLVCRLLLEKKKD